MNDYIVMPLRLAAKYQREWESGYDPFSDMRPSEAMISRRLIAQRDRDDAALLKWQNRPVDDNKEEKARR